jgi:RNA polymerase sigma factor (sigma-70 family)
MLNSDTFGDRSTRYMPTDQPESVIDAAREGAGWAWRRLHDDLAGPLGGYLAVRGARDPEDLVGEVFLDLARNIQDFTGDIAKFRSWAFVVAHHRLIDERRRSRRRPVTVPLDGVDLDVSPDDPEAEALARLSSDRVRRQFEELTPDQRDVLSLRIIAGLTLQETAEALGKRVGAVKALQRRGLAAVRNRIGREGVPL